MAAFEPFQLSQAIRLDFDAAIVTVWNGEPLELLPTGTQFGFVFDGDATLTCDSGNYQLHTGMYFAVPGTMRIRGGSGIVITSTGYRGLFQLGGPIEETGRLRYIDGCTDTLLIAPVLLGDPCLNLLHIPPRTAQSAHTHPSLRAGVIVRGHGECVTPSGRQPLSPGLGFVIEPETLHSFHTQAEPLVVIAWHPDSDFGPTHECHPMINRTILESR